MFCPESNYYIVKEGDTFYSISEFYNVSLDDLVEANPYREPDSIAPGQMLCIPLTAPPVSCPAGSTTYAVQKGDTFYSISKALKISLNTLMKSNPGINPDALLVGQCICIPIMWNNYENSIFRVKFMYPYKWCRIESDRYEGVDGFFHVSVLASDSPISDACDREAYHKLKPYGTHPAITNTSVANHDAHLIMPSTDQPMEMHGQSALVIKYFKPVIISGIAHDYILIRADKCHIRDIIDTLEFIND